MNQPRRGFLQAVAAGAVAPGMVFAQKSARIKIGQIGVGHAHANKLAVYRKSPDYEVVGIVEFKMRITQRARETK